jgi:integrase-like protein
VRRHAYATWLVHDGVPPNMVQRVMGHERASTVLDLYTRRTDNSYRILSVLEDADDEDATTARRPFGPWECSGPSARNDEGPGHALITSARPGLLVVGATLVGLRGYKLNSTLAARPDSAARAHL